MSIPPAGSDPPDVAALRPLHVVGLFPELLGVGGIQEAGRLTAAAVAAVVRERGGTSEFLSLNDPPGSLTMDIDGRDASFRGFGRAKIRFVFSAVRSVRRSSPEFQAIVLAFHPFLALPAFLIRQISPRVKIVVVAHGVEVWRVLPLLRRRALSRANLVCAPSRYTADKLIEVQGVAKETVSVLPWPLSPEFARFAFASGALPPPPSLPSGRIILTVGRWAAAERYKGADDLIRAVAQLKPEFPDLHLVAVGDGDDVPRLVELASSLGVADQVHFLSSLTRAQLAACYSRADIFALPSSGEGFGLVFLEAMAFANPVLGAAIGGTLDLIQDGVNGILVPAQDTPKLASALATLLRDESLRARMGQAGVALVRDRFCFGAFQKQLQKILEECSSSAR